jgi:hypothetical protein
MQCLSTCVGARVLCVHLPGLNLACAPPRGGDARKACHVACPVARGREPRRPARKPDTQYVLTRTLPLLCDLCLLWPFQF